MKLSNAQIKELITGAVDFDESDGKISPLRFTEAQRNVYLSNEDFYTKSHAAAGMKMRFRTDATSLFMDVSFLRGSSRKYYSFDVYSNGKQIGCLDNFSEMEIPKNYAKIDCLLNDASKTFELGEGIKEVCILFPWSVAVQISEITLENATFIEAVKREKTLLVYGDSITQGYDALRPSGRYMTKITDFFGFDEVSKAIGGEIFNPNLAKEKDNFTPDLIYVSYGSNDWNKCTYDEFKSNCMGFFENLRNNYPTLKIIAATPIWRKEIGEERPFGDFKCVEEYIRYVASQIDNIEVISGFNLVPHNEDYFADLRLHPSDAGFDVYFENLKELIKHRI